MSVDAVAGEVIDVMTEAEARRLTTEAQSEFRSAVAHHDRGWQIVATAIKAGGHEALGYRSASDYLEHEFAAVLSGLDVAARRVAVRELSALGMSTRAIAPVVGVSQDTVVKDRHRQVKDDLSPEPESLDAYRGRVLADAESTGKVVKLTGAQSVADPTPAPAPKIIGRDGKEYTRPESKAAETRDYTPEPKRGTDAHALRYVVIPTLSAWSDLWADKALLDNTVDAEEAAQILRDLSKLTPVLSQIRRLLTSRTESIK